MSLNVRQSQYVISTLCAATFSNSYVKWFLRYVMLHFVAVPLEPPRKGAPQSEALRPRKLLQIKMAISLAAKAKSHTAVNNCIQLPWKGASIDTPNTLFTGVDVTGKKSIASVVVTGNNSSPVSLPTGIAGINLLSLKIASVNDTSHKFIVSVVDTGKHWLANISTNFQKHLKRPRAWGTLIPEKNLKSKILWKIPFKLCLVLFTHKRSSMWTALLLYSICGFLGMGVEGFKFFKIDLLTDIAALCLTDCTDWRYIHSFGWYFRPSLWTGTPMDEGTILVYCCPSSFSLTSSPPHPLSKPNVHSLYHWDRYYRVTVDRENWNWGEWRW